MKIKIEYIDNSAISEEEIVSQMKHIFGPSAYIETYPDNNQPSTLIKHAIKNIITDQQVVSFFDDPKRLYDMKVRDLRVDILRICSDIFDEVIEDNEGKWE
jgi:hypothetical protein